MDINQKLIYIETKDIFTSMNSAGELKNSSVVFIGDTGELWTHGKMFGINLSSEIDKIKESYQSAVYYYYTPTANPDAAEKTTKPNIIGYSNSSPISSNFYYFDTKFYQSQSATANRHQMAYGYQSNNIYSRYYYDGKWSTWSRVVLDSDLSKYVTIDTEQSITGSKTFSSAFIQKISSTSVNDCYKNQALAYYALGSSGGGGASGTAGTADTNGFPVSNNANSLLWLGNHDGNYGGQLGISSNSKLYYRFISNGVFDNIPWKQLAFIDDISSTIDSSNLIRYYSKGASDSTTGYYKISINSTTSWMLYFKVRLYQSYNYYDIDISGYNYGTTKMWSSPKARLISSNLDSIEIKFGYDGPNQLWVAIPKIQWWGIGIFDVVNAYTQVSKKDLFTITVEEELTGTVQSTVTLNRLVAKNETIDYATNLAGGALGSIPYQLTSNSTEFLAKPTVNGSFLRFNTSTNKPYWYTDSIFSNLSNSSNKLSITVAGVNKTLTLDYALSATTLKSSGRIAAVEGTTELPYGLRLLNAYNNGYPKTYGNILSMMGDGSSELFMEWTTGSTTGKIYYRSKRDAEVTPWSDWERIVFESDLNNYLKGNGELTTTDCNSIDTLGLWSFSEKTLINGPENIYTYGLFLNLRDGVHTTQIIFPHRTNDSIRIRTSWRSDFEGASSWSKVVTDNNISSFLTNYVDLTSNQTIGGIKTFSNKIITASIAGIYLKGRSNASILFNNNANITTASFHSFFLTKSSSSNVLTYGGIDNRIGFYGYLASRTENGTDYNFTCDTNTGVWTSNKNIGAAGFVKAGSSDSYMLLGGGGHKLLTSVEVGKATHLLGGTKGNIPYQSAASTTTFLTNPSDNAYLRFNKDTQLPYWSTAGIDADTLDGYHASDFYSKGYILKTVYIDATELDEGTYYPVTFRLPSNKNFRIECHCALDGNSKPSWCTHSKGFTSIKVWEVYGSAYGVIGNINRRVFVSYYNFASSDPVRGIGQLTQPSLEYVYVRGGGYYTFYIPFNIECTLHTESYTASGQTISPTTTAPTEITTTIITSSNVFTSLTNSSDKLSMTIGGITKTLTIEYANKASYIKSSGRIAAVSGTTELDTGLRLKTAYNNGYPESYGNVLGIADTGYSELFMGWHSTNLYYRYKSDQETSAWKDWVKIITENDKVNEAVESDKTTRVMSVDNRAVVYDPSDIVNGITMNFQHNTNASTGLSNTYSGIVNFRPYGGATDTTMTDFSGGATHQLAFNMDNKIYYRTGGSSGWASWKKVALEGDYLPISGGTVTGSINPNSNMVHSLGTTTNKWNYIHSKYIGAWASPINYMYAEMFYLKTSLIPMSNLTVNIGDTSHYLNKIYSNSFIKSGSSDNYVLLGGGGHESITNIGLKTVNISDGGSNASRWKVIFSTSSGNGGFGSWVTKHFLVSFSSDTLGTGILSMFLYFTPESLLYKYMNFNGSIGMYDFNQYFKVYWDKTNKLIKIYYNTYNYGKAVIRILNVRDILPTDFADSTDYVSSIPTINGVNIPIVVNNNVGDIGEVIDEINGIYI